ncbi:flavin mononucleotide reductase [Gluconacetobacter johannae DSM 13595]|uniref:Flavin reductase n=1 Tax=Gluconacetobacter johannae TaxID=112140 RepID=A0A7W4J667_9PROT|nr:flavin reductase [Gluconacetobacter johannae]MBB2175193.1 flavin reductase [Gluconacetobacter johannae]GBQ80581.1 flavin mononucleotide reductase [Gluconacetobacter johannae DSM 13595]
MVESALFREGMSWLGSAVNIITTDGTAGRHGFTASAVCSVTDTPPTLLVCMNRTVSSHEAFLQNKALCVNVLGGDHQPLANGFASRRLSMDDRFGLAEWTRLKTQAPALVGATVNFDCIIDKVTSVGTHDVLFCTVQAVSLADNREGLIWLGRSYHNLQDPAAFGRQF